MTDETILAAALAKSDPAERATFLDDACRGDPERRRRLAARLAALDVPADAGATHAHGADEAGGDEAGDALGFLSPPGRPDSLGRLGHYEVLEVLGRGGFGIVFRAFDQTLARVVAVKVLAPQMAATSPARKRFLREARSSAAVRHDNVVQVYAVEEHPLPYLVMELIPGETLQQRLARTGPLDVPEVLDLGRQIAEGLAAAHGRGLIHRDIKPANILIDGGPHPRAKITDFGLARAADDATLTRSGTVAGTPMYMAPEQARGESLDHRADLFSLGSVLYAMLTGRPPFRAENTLAVLKRVADDTPRPIREIIPEVPEWLCRVVGKLHAKNPADRFQTAREVANLLADCERQVQAHGALKDFSRIPGGSAPRATRRRRWAALVLALLVPLAAWGVYAATRPGEQPPAPAPGDARADAPAPVATPTAPPPAAEGFAPLFNGKDRTGWNAGRAPGNTWKVENRILVGRDDPAGPRLSDVPLLTTRGDFADFHLRAEARVVAGSGQIVVRQRSDKPGARYSGYTVYLDTRKGNFHTGAMMTAADFKAQTVPQGKELTRPGEWFVLDVIARGNRLQTLVDGKPAADFTDAGRNYTAGFIRLSGVGPGTEVQFRKIEIRELPPAAPAMPPIDMDAPRHALAFDGRGYVDLPLLDYKAGDPLCVEMWVTPGPPPKEKGRWARQMAWRSGSWGVMVHESGRWSFSRPFTRLLTSPDPVVADRRTHLAAVWDGTSTALFVDGKLQERSPPSDRPELSLVDANTIPSHRVGAGNNITGGGLSAPFHGTIEQVRVSRTARYTVDFTPPERFGRDADTVSLYRFDEGTGDVLNDASGNGHHGKIVGAKWVAGEPAVAPPPRPGS